ncbi:MAG: hypothetical protein IPN95_00235 [Bacteroidetes bacterium]|nr:hypothetical protein [Bacteroidota bacterium]
MVICVCLLASANGYTQRMRVDSIVVTGLKKTKRPVITRQMVFQEGDTIDLQELEALNKVNKDNIYNMGLFTSVAFANEIGDSSIEVHISVQERWYIWPNPYVNLAERVWSEWLTIPIWTGSFTDWVEWSNLSGWNDKLTVYAQGGYTQAVTATYSRPFLFPKAKVDGTAFFSILNDKEIGYGTQGGYLQLARLNDERMRQSYTGQLTLGKRFSRRGRFCMDSPPTNTFHINDSITFFNTEYLPYNLTAIHYPSVGRL